MAKWTPEQEEFLRTYYPIEGRDWCAEKLGMTQASIRQKACRLNLRARGVSKTWQKAQAEIALKNTGKKRTNETRKKISDSLRGVKKSEQHRRALSMRAKEWHKHNEHPRSMKGKNHTKTARDLISKASQDMWANMSQDKKHQIIIKRTKTRHENGSYAQPRNASWKSGWRDFGGKRNYYRSRWEANYGRYLEWLKLNNQIIDWEHEPEVFWFEGVKRGTVSYLPDFRVTNNDGSIEYHEVKGWMDNKSKTKIKRMAKYHPTVKLIVIQKKEYEGIKAAVSKLIKDWE